MAFSMKLPAAKKPALNATADSSGAKQYGLILPAKKEAKKGLAPTSVFAAAVDDEASSAAKSDDKAAERRRVGAEAARSLQRAQVERTHEKALAEDATVFDYDGVYDEIQSSRDSKRRERKAQRESEKQSSKYISTLLQKASVREIEHERIRERRLLKERASEDALYGDKEKLVSASYKRKLQEMKRWDEEDRRLDALEAAEDVTKRGSDAMAGFYSNLLTNNLAMGATATNARSAYTVGHGDRAETPADTQKSPPRRDDVEESVDKTNTREENTSSVKRARVADDDTRVATERDDREPPARKPEAAAAPVAPEPTKEETISAARARFLARKAMRQQQQES